MYELLVSFSRKWPWVRMMMAPIRATTSCNRFPPALVTLPIEEGGGWGVIHHYKTDGNFGVRPVDVEGNFQPNRSEHWTPAQRQAIPHEISLPLSKLTAPRELPGWAK